MHLGDNRLTGCIPSALTDVRLNDFEWFTLPICAEPPEEEVDLAPVVGAGLVQDADLLLAIRDELAGEGTLNWSIGTGCRMGRCDVVWRSFAGDGNRFGGGFA